MTLNLSPEMILVIRDNLRQVCRPEALPQCTPVEYGTGDYTVDSHQALDLFEEIVLANSEQFGGLILEKNSPGAS